jgi:hypothetical protein
MSDSSNLNDTFYKDLLTDQSSLVDVPHHDVPERHEFGGALLAPGLPSSIAAGVASAGKSQAPARGDHIHGYTAPIIPPAYVPPLDVTKLARGIVATYPSMGVLNIGLGGSSVLGSSYATFTAIAGRYYIFHINIRAIGPVTDGTMVGCRFTMNGVGAFPNLDAYWSGSRQWSAWSYQIIFVGDGGAKQWHVVVGTIWGGNVNIYPTDMFIVDAGAI